MPQPTGRDLYIEKLLSNVSLGYSLDPKDYVVDSLFPIVNVPQQSGKIGKYNKGDWFRDEAEKRAPGTESSGGGYKHETPAEFFCDELATPAHLKPLLNNGDLHQHHFVV